MSDREHEWNNDDPVCCKLCGLRAWSTAGGEPCPEKEPRLLRERARVTELEGQVHKLLGELGEKDEALRSAAERSAGERRPGTEPPRDEGDGREATRDVLAYIDGEPFVAWYATGQWGDKHGMWRVPPDFWQELPPIDRDGRRKGGGG